MQKALQLYTKAADLGDAGAANNIGMMYSSGNLGDRTAVRGSKRLSSHTFGLQKMGTGTAM